MFGFLRVAAAFPEIKVGDIEHNKKNIIDEIVDLNEKGVKIVVFPELSLTSCSLYDVFFDEDILDAAKKALSDILVETKDFDILIVLSLPYKYNGSIYDVSAVIKKGEILSFVPRRKISETKVLSSKNFSDAKNINTSVDFNIEDNINSVIFSPNVVINLKDFSDLTVSINYDNEEDNFLSTNIVLNPSIMYEDINVDNKINKKRIFSDEEKISLITAAPNFMESTSRFIFFSRAYVFECGKLISKNDNLGKNSIISDIDIDVLLSKKKKVSDLDKINYIDIFFDETKYTHLPQIYRSIEPEPYSFSQNEMINVSNRIINILSVALMKRMRVIKAKNIIIGVSGGLDSTLALLICNKTRQMMKNLNVDIIAINMPCFGTSNRSLENVNSLCGAIYVNLRTIDITESIKLHFNNINHDLNDTNVTFENAQSRERTKVLMDVANDNQGIVIGTSDMSESALGFSTYSGDQFSMYNLISSIPKTLVRKILKVFSEYYVNENIVLSNVLENILSMPISPELLPAVDGMQSQNTELILGNYKLHDFFMYYYLNYNFSIEKIYDLSLYAFKDEFEEGYIKQCINTFFDRFFKMQFKRNATADSPFIGFENVDSKIGFVAVSDLEIWKQIL